VLTQSEHPRSPIHLACGTGPSSTGEADGGAVDTNRPNTHGHGRNLDFTAGWRIGRTVRVCPSTELEEAKADGKELRRRAEDRGIGDGGCHERAGGAGGDGMESQAGSAVAVAGREVWAAADRVRGQIAKLQPIFSKKKKTAADFLERGLWEDRGGRQIGCVGQGNHGRRERCNLTQVWNSYFIPWVHNINTIYI
jgi:hypothetical protein